MGTEFNFKCTGISNSSCGKWIHYTLTTEITIITESQEESVTFSIQMMNDALDGFKYVYGQQYPITLVQT